MREWLARVRKSKLSTRVAVLFGGAFVLPWCAYAWLTAVERADQVERTERYLAALASAYAQHAATLQPDAGAPSNSRLEEELAAFRAGLNVPGVTFSLVQGEPSVAGFTAAFHDREG